MYTPHVGHRGWKGPSTALILVALLAPDAGAAQTHSLESPLAGLSFDRIDRMALEGGRVVVNLPDTDDDRDVIVVGATRVRVPLTALLEQFRDPETLFAGDGFVTRIERFDDDPGAGDLEALRLPTQDVEALRECAVGRCKVKLAAAELQHIHGTVDWSEDDSGRQATTALARALLARLRAYRGGGDAALPAYHDRAEADHAANDLGELLTGSHRFKGYDAELFHHVKRFPNGDAAGVEHQYYWTLEEFGMKPVIALNHMLIVPSDSGASTDAAIAIKQIYASHYFQALLRFVHLRSVSPRQPFRGTYLVLSAHVRFDGRVGGLKRALLERELKHRWARHVELLGERLEERYRACMTRSRARACSESWSSSQ